MKKVKMINALKAFELKNKSMIQGGVGIVRWVGSDGRNQICDIQYANGTWECSVPDGGVVVGTIVPDLPPSGQN